MDEHDLLSDYFAENFPRLHESDITDPEMRSIWIAKATTWKKNQTATGFRKALVEFKRLQGLRHHSRSTTLKHAIQALKHAGLL